MNKLQFYIALILFKNHQRCVKMENIKLVIWDLDNTLWNGILSEDENNIIIPYQNVTLIKKLSERGIMNSICSENNYNKVKEILEKQGIWDYFIFPQINYAPKNEMINNIIEKTHFREQNILFIDDEKINREEVIFHHPNINTGEPQIINELALMSQKSSNSDPLHTRLKQYKILEKKENERINYSSDEAFLSKCNIKVSIIKDCMPYADRIFELMERTSQLNFTKVHPENKKQVIDLLKDKNIQTRCIKVCDKFGDYGICGFYALKDNTLIHFLFSCRLLNLHIEEWLYAWLKYPDINIKGEVAITLNKNDYPSWISLCDNYNLQNKKEPPHIKNKLNCIMRGGCELSQVAYYLSCESINIHTEFNYTSLDGYPIHREGTQFLAANIEKNIYTKQVKKFLTNTLPFYDKNIFTTQIFNNRYDVIIMAPLIDYTQGLYQMKKNKNIIVSYGDYNLPITDKNNYDKFIETSNGIISEEFLNYFKEDFDYIGPMTPEKFINNLFIIRNNISSDKIMIFLNGSEVNLEHKIENERCTRHKIMNDALREFISSSDNCFMVDVTKYVKTKDDVVDNIRHYKRSCYKKISDDILDILNARFPFIKNSNKKSKSLISKISFRMFCKNNSK